MGVYRAAVLDQQLDLAARNFLNQEVALDARGCVTCSRILEWYGRSADALVVAPLPALRGEVALTAWTRLATCTHFDPRAFGAFRDAYRYRGPEQLPLGALQPGT